MPTHTMHRFRISRQPQYAIGEYSNGNGNGAFTGGSRVRPTLFTELQIKF